MIILFVRAAARELEHIVKWVLTYRSLPEFRNTSPETRDEVWSRCIKRAPQRTLDFYTFWISVILLSIGIAFLISFLGVEGGLPTAFSYPAAYFLAEGSWQRVLLHRARRFIVEEMPGHCADCGYDLGGVATQRCPECGGSVSPLRTARVAPVTTDG